MAPKKAGKVSKAKGWTRRGRCGGGRAPKLGQLPGVAARRMLQAAWRTLRGGAKAGWGCRPFCIWRQVAVARNEAVNAPHVVTSLPQASAPWRSVARCARTRL